MATFQSLEKVSIQCQHLQFYGHSLETANLTNLTQKFRLGEQALMGGLPLEGGPHPPHCGQPFNSQISVQLSV